MPDYDAMNKELPKLRAALTRAKNSGDPLKVIAAVKHANARFDVIGWPDQWSMWERAKDDAELQIRMANKIGGW